MASYRTLAHFVLIVFFALICNAVKAQPAKDSAKHTLIVNPTYFLVDTTKLYRISNFIDHHLQRLNETYRQKDSSAWAGAIGNWKMPDQILTGLERDIFDDNTSIIYRATILSTQEIGVDTFETKVAYMCSRDDRAYLKAIYNFIVKVGDTISLIPQVDYYTKGWSRKQEGAITFIYPPKHVFNENAALETVAFNDKMAHFFTVTRLQFDYYTAPNLKTVYSINGFDFKSEMTLTEQYGGFADITNTKIFSGNNSESYPHEIAHLYIWKVFQNNIHDFYSEGLATYFGGSMGHDYYWHIRELQAYLKTHELDLNNLLSYQNRAMSNESNFAYTLAAFICDYIVKHKGKEYLLAMASHTKTDDAFYAETCRILGVTRDKLGKFLLKEINNYK